MNAQKTESVALSLQKNAYSKSKEMALKDILRTNVCQEHSNNTEIIINTKIEKKL